MESGFSSLFHRLCRRRLHCADKRLSLSSPLRLSPSLALARLPKQGGSKWSETLSEAKLNQVALARLQSLLLLLPSLPLPRQADFSPDKI